MSLALLLCFPLHLMICLQASPDFLFIATHTRACEIMLEGIVTVYGREELTALILCQTIMKFSTDEWSLKVKSGTKKLFGKAMEELQCSRCQTRNIHWSPVHILSSSWRKTIGRPEKERRKTEHVCERERVCESVRACARARVCVCVCVCVCVREREREREKEREAKEKFKCKTHH